MNIWTNGCFDIIHIGHIRLFEYAKSLGQILHVGIDSDRRIKTKKGLNRPINTENYRKELLCSIKYIDSVSLFDTDEELEDLIKIKNIDIIVVGSDYKNLNVIGSNIVKTVKFFDKIPDISTTKILNANK